MRFSVYQPEPGCVRISRLSDRPGGSPPVVAALSVIRSRPIMGDPSSGGLVWHVGTFGPERGENGPGPFRSLAAFRLLRDAKAHARELLADPAALRRLATDPPSAFPVRFTVAGEAPRTVPLADFLAANRDGIDPADVPAFVADLAGRRLVTWGGGAAPVVRIARADL